VLLNLYSASAVQAAAFDAARLVAADGTDTGSAQRLAEDHVRSVLGEYGEERVKTVSISFDGDSVALTVTARNPSLLPRLVPGGLLSNDIERSVRVRVERRRPAVAR
jgi:hypothetical protein